MTVFVCTAADSRKADSITIHEIGIPSLVLMEHAALQCAQIIEKEISSEQKVLILCGPGNNGADGLAVSRLLYQKGYRTAAVLKKDGFLSREEEIQYKVCRNLGIEILQETEEINLALLKADLIVDALFGSGLSRDIEGFYAQLIEKANASGRPIFSIDIASGINGTTGEKMGTCIKAEKTLSLDGIKTGQLLREGKYYSGKLIPLKIGIPEQVHESMHSPVLLDFSAVSRLLPERKADAHKGNFGKGLIIGGSSRMHGAVCMAADACYHAGIGTLSLLVPRSVADIAAMKMNQVMIFACPQEDGKFADGSDQILQQHLEAFDPILIGNGMQKSQEAAEMLTSVLHSKKTVVIDADGLNLLADHIDLLEREAPVILTPHLKEMSRLCRKSVQEIAEDPFTAVREFIVKYPSAVLVLKSDLTIAAGKEGMYVLYAPNPALSKGGSGDILAGIILAMAGQCTSALQAAAAGVGLHSLAAAKAEDSASFQPEELISNLSSVFAELRRYAIRQKY